MSTISASDLSTPRPPSRTHGYLDLVRYAARKAPVAVIKSKPWFAIGGISLDNIDAVIEAGRGGSAWCEPSPKHPIRRKRLSGWRPAAWKADPAMERYVFQADVGYLKVKNPHLQ